MTLWVILLQCAALVVVVVAGTLTCTTGHDYVARWGYEEVRRLGLLRPPWYAFALRDPSRQVWYGPANPRWWRLCWWKLQSAMYALAVRLKCYRVVEGEEWTSGTWCGFGRGGIVVPKPAGLLKTTTLTYEDMSAVYGVTAPPSPFLDFADFTALSAQSSIIHIPNRPVEAPAPHPRTGEIIGRRAWELRVERDQMTREVVVELTSLNRTPWDGPVLHAEAHVDLSNPDHLKPCTRVQPTLDDDYGVYALSLDGGDVSYLDRCVTGLVALSGVVIEGRQGYRAERATIQSLVLDLSKRTQLPDDIAPFEIAMALEAKYQCPCEIVGSRELVVEAELPGTLSFSGGPLGPAVQFQGLSITDMFSAPNVQTDANGNKYGIKYVMMADYYNQQAQQQNKRPGSSLFGNFLP